MAGTPMALQVPSSAGIAPVYNAVALQNSIVNGGRTVVHIKNGSGASINATLVSNGTLVDGTAVPNKVVAVPAGAERVIGPIPPGLYNFSDGTCEVDISAIATVTMAVYNIP